MRILALSVFMVLPAVAGSFQHQDWELACDNTRTCRAAGYNVNHPEAIGISVLLERKAGPSEPVTATLQLGTAESSSILPASGQVTMTIDGNSLGIVGINPETGVGKLSQHQTDAFLAALAKNSVFQWSSDELTWVLSGAGAAAVLLKMDDWQGRIGTPGALIRKGSKPEDSVLQALPLPVVQAVPVNGAKVSLSKAQQNALRPVLAKLLKKDECPEFGKEFLAATRLDTRKLLVSTLCWRGIRDMTYGFWVLNSTAPQNPVLVTTGAWDHSDGTITAYVHGTGYGDCRHSDEWTWDGQRFRHTLESTTGMCRMVALGGAWELPTIVSDVRRSSSGKPK